VLMVEWFVFLRHRRYLGCWKTYFPSWEHCRPISYSGMSNKVKLNLSSFLILCWNSHQAGRFNCGSANVESNPLWVKMRSGWINRGFSNAGWQHTELTTDQAAFPLHQVSARSTWSGQNTLDGGSHPVRERSNPFMATIAYCA